MKIELTKNNAKEVRQRIELIAGNPDRLSVYGLTSEHTDNLIKTIPKSGGEWAVPWWATQIAEVVTSDMGTSIGNISSDTKLAVARNALENIRSMHFEGRGDRWTVYNISDQAIKETT